VSSPSPAAARVPTALRVRSRAATRTRRRHVAARTLGYAVLIAVSAAAVVPFAWMLLTSVRRSNTVFGSSLLPDHVTLHAYSQVWTQLDMLRHFLNSVLITAVTVAAVLILATLAGYSFAKLRFPGKQAIYLTLLSTLMLPATAIIVPLFLELRTLSLIDTPQGLILVYVGTALPLAMFLMRAFFETLPDELADAARIDGAGEFVIFWRIMLPLAAPGVATLTIFQFMLTWNEFLFANTFMQTPDKMPLQPVLYSLVGQYSTNWPALCAALTISVIPIVAVYVRMQRRFVSGLTLGAVK
jgi:ABC-type glycerol-3-phosphate transport system permease component